MLQARGQCVGGVKGPPPVQSTAIATAKLPSLGCITVMYCRAGSCITCTHTVCAGSVTHIHLVLRRFALVVNVSFSTANMYFLGDCISDLIVQQ